jgi:hypothetical protein
MLQAFARHLARVLFVLGKCVSNTSTTPAAM